MLRQFLFVLVSKLPHITIMVNDKPYLTRYYVFLKDRNWGNIYIHHFHSSDQFQNLHSHPWSWGLSFVLSGGYFEERVVWERDFSYKHIDGTVDTSILMPKIIKRHMKPGCINLLRARDMHRVDLCDEKKGAWSLFVAGRRPKRSSEWGFMDRDTFRYRDWRTEPGAIE